MTAQGMVVIDKDIPDFSKGLLSVYVEDTGLVDAAAIRLATWRQGDIVHRRGTPTTVGFAVDYCPVDMHSDHLVRVHLSLADGNSSAEGRRRPDRDPDIALGDLVSTQAYPLRLSNLPNYLTIAIHPVS